LKKRFIEWDLPLVKIFEEFWSWLKIDEAIYATGYIISKDSSAKSSQTTQRTHERLIKDPKMQDEQETN